MVGEIRDAETAKISIEAALTGHLVLSTLHTNDAPERAHAPQRDGRRAVPHRLGRLGRARAAARAQALHALLARCTRPSPEELVEGARLARASRPRPTAIALYRKRGCPRCGQTGYKGRIGVFQLLLMSESLEQLAAAKASREEIERAAIAEGMRTLWDDGLAKVVAGLTSLEELAAHHRLAPRPVDFDGPPAASHCPGGPCPD